jgi:glyoxylase-like metal-dependent hydrolase (beta-lactamase superfamily II)
MAEHLVPFGVTPQDVTHLCLSHLHFDHVGGATRWQNGVQGGPLEVTFPNAEIWVHEENGPMPANLMHAVKPVICQITSSPLPSLAYCDFAMAHKQKFSPDSPCR